jgi:peptidyl-prolyl cis-trans isomerase B (cyclophilin B)
MKINSKKLISAILCAIMLFGLTACSSDGDFSGNMSEIRDLRPGDVYAEITFRDFEGTLTFVLFEDIAPIGVKEFITHAEHGYYDNKTIHRVLKDTLIQGGALNMNGTDLNGIPENEMFEVETHKNARNFNGALAFAVNESSGMNYRQFYVVTASRSVDIAAQIAAIDEQIAEFDEDVPDEIRKQFADHRAALAKIPAAVKERYKEKGGIPLFDDKVTVFGQLITGHDLLREISQAEVVRGNAIDDNNTNIGGGHGQPSRPADDIFIGTVRIIRVEPEETTR